MHGVDAYSDRRLASGERGGQRELLVAPAAPFSIYVDTIRDARTVPRTSELIVDVDVCPLVGHAIIKGATEKGADVVRI